MTKACDSYHVPANVRRHLDYVTPGIRLLAPRVKNNRKRSVPEDDAFKLIPAKFPKSISNTSELATCDVAITPACVAALYQIPPVAAGYKARADNSLGIFEEGDYYAQEDLDLFFANFTTIPQGTSPIPAFIDGAVAPVPVDEAGGESDLDFELSYPIIYPQTITLYQTDDIYYATEASGGFLNTFLDALDGSYCDYLDRKYISLRTPSTGLTLSSSRSCLPRHQLHRWLRRNLELRHLHTHQRHLYLLRWTRSRPPRRLPNPSMYRVHETRTPRCLNHVRIR